MIIWFKGISGVGKSSLGGYFYKIKKKKIKNLVYVDGDIFRKLFKNDLGYTLKDRNINASRICAFVKFLQLQKINVVVSANLTSKKYQNLSKKIYHNYLSIFIESKLSNLKIRDKKKIYKNKNNIVGLNIKYDKPKNSDLHITNDSTYKKFIGNIKLIEKLIKKKKIIFD
jgi:adenylylsulfate kinase-like enzyme